MAIPLTADQIIEYIRQMDEDYKRNRAAAEILLNSLRGGGINPSPTTSTTFSAPKAPTLADKIAKIMEAEPDRKWTPRDLFVKLKEQGHTFGKTDAMKRIGNSVPKLVSAGLVVLVMRGSGSTPHQYQWHTKANKEPHDLSFFMGKPQ